MRFCPVKTRSVRKTVAVRHKFLNLNDISLRDDEKCRNRLFPGSRHRER